MTKFDVLLPRAGPRSLVEPGARPSEPAQDGAGPDGAGKVRFEDVLTGEIGGRVKLSAHARDRLATRGIELSSVELDAIGRAMERVARKGGRESLFIGPKAAFVVSVENRTIITAMARDELKDNVFTKIDSAVVL